MQSVFDPNLFKQMSFNQVGSTEVVLVPATEHRATISKYELGTWETKDKSSSGGKVEWSFDIADPDGKLKDLTGRDKNAVRYEFLLDLTPEGGLDMGKGMNVRLNRMLVAAGIKDGQPWSFDSLLGRDVIVKVAHGVSNKGNPFAQVESVRAA